MTGLTYDFPARLEVDEEGRVLVQFPDLPEALTDGADEAEALVEASDCLSEALAARMADGQPIPPPRRTARGMHLVSPEPRIALKSALYEATRKRGMTASDLARLLGISEPQAVRLLSPRAMTRLASLEQALDALGYTIGIEVREKRIA
jgi:antitoxin HicB